MLVLFLFCSLDDCFLLLFGTEQRSRGTFGLTLGSYSSDFSIVAPFLTCAVKTKFGVSCVCFLQFCYELKLMMEIFFKAILPIHRCV